MSLSDIGFSFTEAGSEAHQSLQLWQPRWPLWLGQLVAFVIVPLIGGGISNWFAYVLALLFLLVRPAGLFGEPAIERV